MRLGRMIGRATAVLAASTVTACGGGDAGLPGVDVLAGFEAGAPRDEVIEALPDGGVTSSDRVGDAELRNGYVLERYLIDAGRVEVLWIHDPDEGLPEGEDELRSGLNPVVFLGGALDGSGWRHYESRVEEWGLPDSWSVPTMSEVSPPSAPDAPAPGDGPEGSPPDDDGGRLVPDNPTNRA